MTAPAAASARPSVDVIVPNQSAFSRGHKAFLAQRERETVENSSTAPAGGCRGRARKCDLTDQEELLRQAWLRQLGAALVDAPSEPACEPVTHVTGATDVPTAVNAAATGGGGLRQGWPWVMSGAGLCLAVLITPPAEVEQAIPPGGPQRVVLPQVHGWSSDAGRAGLRTEGIVRFGYHGIEKPVPVMALPALPPVALWTNTGGDPATRDASPYAAPPTEPLDAIAGAPASATETAGQAAASLTLSAGVELESSFVWPEPSWGARVIFDTPPRIAKPAEPTPRAAAADVVLPSVSTLESWRKPPTGSFAQKVAAKPSRATARTAAREMPRAKSPPAVRADEGQHDWRDQAFSKDRFGIRG
jgi:hypothetical protein